MKTEEDNIVKIAKALSDKTRIKILVEIAKLKSVNCHEAEKIAGLSQPTVSHHLKILVEAGLLNAIKTGRYVEISVNKKELDRFADLISDNIKV
jgi:DNA-binding transcriptional ArsR family regulator